MEATVHDVLPGLVRFGSPHGGGLAVWKGDSPTIGATYFVEVDVDEVVPAERLRRSPPDDRPGRQDLTHARIQRPAAQGRAPCFPGSAR